MLSLKSTSILLVISAFILMGISSTCHAGYARFTRGYTCADIAMTISEKCKGSGLSNEICSAVKNFVTTNKIKENPWCEYSSKKDYASFDGSTCNAIAGAISGKCTSVGGPDKAKACLTVGNFVTANKVNKELWCQTTP